MNIYIGIALLVIAGIGLYIFDSSEKETLVSSETIQTGTSTLLGVKSAAKENVLTGARRTALLDFTKADYETALKSKKLVMLYFYANWCPICKKEFPEMQAAFETAPDSVAGFRVNFKDDQTDADEAKLAREFGITYQHTKVFIKNGMAEKNILESWNREQYIQEINKRL